MNRDAMIQEWSDRFTEHSLSEVTPKTRTFRLSEGNKRCMSCLITFTPEGITISGDITPIGRGVTSSLGYGIDWFASELSPDYLAEKFLERKFVPEIAAEEMKDPENWVQESLLDMEDDREQKIAELNDLINDVECGEVGPERLGDRLLDIGISPYDGLPGYCYHPNELAILVSIQRRFAALYKEIA